jgi:RNA polymerase sigma-70 factor (ECF subfamily)
MAKEEEQISAGAAPIQDSPGPESGGLEALSDEDLARRSQQGCRDSFAELVGRFGVRLLKFLRRQTNNLQDAEDLVQDTFVRAYANIGTYQSTYKFSTWLFTIARHLACSRLHRQRRHSPFGEPKASLPEPPEELERRQMSQSLWDTAAILTSNQHQALWLKYAEDMPIKQIAKVMGKSQVGVKVTLCRARMRLAEKLQNMAAKEVLSPNPSSKETLAFMKVEGV